jgi:N-acetylglucosamine-6-sulfatase
MRRTPVPAWALLITAAVLSPFSARVQAQQPANLELERIPGAKPRNVVLMLVDDLRHDAFGFTGHPFVETPHIDALARGGAHFRNAFVTTALCSPSRATILTGLYAHRHRVVDNNNPVPANLTFFPQYLQKAGYETAFVGKWHMGGASDDPQRGFDHWVSFRGQGTYLPSRNGLNVNGQRVPQKGYITDELTDYALDWLGKRSGDRPFFLYLSHKATHADFVPAERHRGRYKDRPVAPPKTMADTPENYAGKPMWVKNQRNSWHGVDFPYHSDLDIAEYYRRYLETLLAVDDSVGRVMEHLRRRNLDDDTLVLFMGDNGFLFGEHGLIDKRCAYEESIRVPLIAHCRGLIRPGTKVDQVTANLDIVPTILEAAGLRPPAALDGRSAFPLLEGRQVPWRENLLYEYYWERNFPHTPTVHALRGSRYKYIHYHGIWDTDELYDLTTDPKETRNLVRSPEHQQTVRQMNRELFELLEQTGGMYIPLYPDRGGQQNLRRDTGSKGAEFPDYLIRSPGQHN